MRPLRRLLPGYDQMHASNGTVADPGKVQKGWWVRPSDQNHNANFRRMGDCSIEESLGIYGPRTLITANRMELDDRGESQPGIRVEREIIWE